MDIKRYYSSLFAMLFLMSACSKDEPDTTFMGTWLLQASEKRGCDDSGKNSEKDSNFVFNTPCNSETRFLCLYEKYVFDEAAYSLDFSSTLFTIPISGNDQGTYTIQGSTLTICEQRSSGEEDCSVYTYSINGNTMSLEFVDIETGCSDIDYYLKQ